MKTQLFYFSGTGNTLAIAKSLAGKLGDTEIISIPTALKKGIQPEAENIGIIFPVYSLGTPLMVQEFLEKIPGDNKNRYFFSVCNCGGAAGRALYAIEKPLKIKGIKLSSGFILYMPSNYIPFGGAESEQRQKKRFCKAEKKLAEITEAVKNKEERGLETNFFPLSLLSVPMFKLFMRLARHCGIKKLHVDDKCNSCGLCVKVCPADNIRLEDGKPVWDVKCEVCMACLQWCPQEAIQYTKISQKRKRYHHPEIKAEELFTE